MRALALLCVFAACGQTPGPLEFTPVAEVPLTVRAEPPAGPFNGEVTVTFTSIRPATIYVSTNGTDPRHTSDGRVSGESPFTMTLSATTTVKYFASAQGKDGPLYDETWTRAGGPAGTIAGVLVVGGFSTGKAVGLHNNGALKNLGVATGPSELPFFYENLASGTYQLRGISDRTGEGQLTPLLDFQGSPVTIEVDLTDPFKAGPENVRVYLGASAPEYGTLRGVITLPKPPLLQSLRVSLLDPASLVGGLSDPAALLSQLQNGYDIVTTPLQTEYPYVITGLSPGNVTPAPSLIGFANGGLAINLIVDPLRPAVIKAGEETVANFEFGPVELSGNIVLGPESSPGGNVNIGLVAARAVQLLGPSQLVLMPVIFTDDNGDAVASYAGQSLKRNQSFTLKVFAGLQGLTEALTWVFNPLGAGDTTVQTSADEVTADITKP